MFTSLHLDDFRIFKNQTISIGKTITAIAGHNATGKSTVLGILGNACELKSKYGTTITDKQFKTEFSELFRGSKTFDKPKGDIGSIIYQERGSDEITKIGLRVTWQKWEKDSAENNRFRILPKWKDLNVSQNITAKKLPLPSFYLGLSRLYPLGEDTNEIIAERKFKKRLNDSDIEWIIRNYKHILSLEDDIDSISNYEIYKKRSGGINTNHYDFLSNSSGQDNLMQILYLLLSFIKLKEEYETKQLEWKGGILLIDELDATLHPAAQIRLVELLYNTCRQFDFQAVFTTHSLHILEYISTLSQKNNDVSIEYFTTANGILEIRHNPEYESMENDMTISNFYMKNSNRKITIYSEDKEARWLIKKTLSEYEDKYKLVDIKLGGESLMSLLYNDPEYFKNVLFILDGDKDLSNTKYKDLPYKHCNVLFLPGKEGPEALIYNYLTSLPSTHKLLSENFDKGITLRVLKEMNPLTNSTYATLKKNREKYKKWFNDYLPMLEDIDAIQYWMSDNQNILNEFKKQFVNKYNIVASRTKIPKIN